MVTQRPPFKTVSVLLPIVVLIIAMFCFQVGAVLAKQVFPVVGAAGATALRLGLSGLMLLAVFRPWRLRPGASGARNIVIYGIAMGCMNLCFYMSLERIPLGIAMALEFTGPLSVAIAMSRRVVDFCWVALAVLGLTALLPLGLGSQPLDAVGVALALSAGVFWALYIVFGQRAGGARGGQTVALGTVVAAIIIVPIGFRHAGTALLAPALLPIGFALAVVSSALPYSLEMYALTRLPARTFGVLMSGDPALGALAGMVFLGETLTLIQWAAIASIMVASAGSAATHRRAPEVPGTARSLPD